MCETTISQIINIKKVSILDSRTAPFFVSYPCVFDETPRSYFHLDNQNKILFPMKLNKRKYRD